MSAIDRTAPFQVRASRTVYRNRWMHLREDTLQYADGSEAPFAVVERADFVLVLPYLGDAVLLVRQYRHPILSWTWELPQGACEVGERAVDAARRELREETGWEADRFEVLGHLYEAAGFATESCTIVQASLTTAGRQRLDREEAGMQWQLVSRSDLDHMLRSGLLQDAPSIAALHLADAMRPRPASGAESSSRPFAWGYLDEMQSIARQLDEQALERCATLLAAARAAGGRVVVLGVGGSAANASQVVNDFRTLANIEAYAPTSNVAELTVCATDDWATVFEGWLQGSRLRPEDVVLVLSVGGGSVEHNVSVNLVEALRYTRAVGARIVAIVGRAEGYAADVADECILIPAVNANDVDPHAETFQAAIWHLLVSHPALKQSPTKWESITRHRLGASSGAAS